MELYTLKNLDCADCARKIQRRLKTVPGVRSLSIDFPTQTLSIDARDLGPVKAALHQIEPDITIEPYTPSIHTVETQRPINVRIEIIAIGVACVCVAAGYFFHRSFLNTGYHFLEYLVIFVAYGLCGYRVVTNALRTVFAGRMFDENVLMTIATLGAMALHELPEAASVMVLFRVGDLFERLALHRSRKSIFSLLAMKPDSASVLENGTVSRTAPEKVVVGRIILVGAGERVPLDGTIISGQSQLDTSALTGEHLPRDVSTGDSVCAGHVNGSGVLTIRVTKEFSGSTLSKIMDLTQRAMHRKAAAEQFITKFARYYTPMVVACALCVAIVPPLLSHSAVFSEWLHRALVLLVISCPCALVISIPLGYFGGVGAASKKGILVKGSNVFDDLIECASIVFDKTGTLTKGELIVTGVAAADGFDAERVLSAAAAAQSHSRHPIARAIVKYFKGAIEAGALGDYVELPGMGVIAGRNGKRVIVGNDRLMHQENIPHSNCSSDGTIVHVAIDGAYAGSITIGDRIKDDAAEALVALKKAGIGSFHMVTGDNICAARAVAEKLGIVDYHAELLPQDKLTVMEKLMEGMEKGKKIAFVGDGINDAPVIARADVGIAMGDGSDAAIETADVVIMSGSPVKVAEAITIARRTKAVVWQNIALAFAVKGFFICLGIAGTATMWEAVFADIGVALLAIFNAARLVKG